MRLSNLLVVALALAACSPAWAQKPNPNDFGRPATPEDIAKLDFSINPVTGAELPPGHGTAKEGAPLFAAKCAVCHGPTVTKVVCSATRSSAQREQGGHSSCALCLNDLGLINRAMPRFNEEHSRTIKSML